MRTNPNSLRQHISTLLRPQTSSNASVQANSFIGRDLFHIQSSTLSRLQFQGKHSDTETENQVLLQAILLKKSAYTLTDFQQFLAAFQRLKRPHLPLLPGADPLTQIHQFTELTRIENTTDLLNTDKQRLRHFCRAELMLLTQQVLRKKPGEAETVISAQNTLTEDLLRNTLFSDRFFHPENFLKLLGLAGTINFSFKHFKHDARGGKESLLSKQGAVLLEESVLDKPFDTGYALDLNQCFPKYFEQGCTMVFRRGFMALIRPQDTIVFRNSSPIFGRDCLPEPLLYTDADLSTINPSTLNPAKDSRFHPLDYAYFDTLNDTALEAVEVKLNTCREAIETFWIQMLQLKLDTQDFASINGQKSFVGVYKSGFQQLVEHLSILYTDYQFQQDISIQSVPPPALEFVDPLLPPTAPFPFEHKGKTYTQFLLTKEHLEELQALSNQEWSAEKYPNSLLMAFLQAGSSNRAVLMLADPEKQPQKTPL